METHELVQLVRHHWARVSISGEDIAKEASEAFKAAGITANVHVGKKNFTRRMTVEWYAGSLVDMVDSGQLLGMNAWCNTVDKFCPKEWAQVEEWV